MKLQYESGKLSFDFWDMVQELSDAEKMQLLEGLSCDDSAIKFVTQQILDGWTESGYFGGRFVTASAEPNHGLDWACRQVALRSGEVAKKEIERLQDALAFAEKKYQDLCNERYERGQGRF